jgi:hypothetical protein
MSVARLNLDFQRRATGRVRAGPVLLAAGLAVCLGMYLAYSQVADEMAGIELQLGALQPAAVTHGRGPDPAVEAARATATRLATPWSQLLDDLEAANADSDGAVALLEVEPDRDSGRVRLVAEARSLAAALGYLERLEKSPAISHPLLESHEIRTDVRERPVRVSISADWRQAS